MALFEGFMPNKEKELEKKELAAEHRNKTFSREQNIIGNAVENDNTYLHYKEEKQDLTRWQQDLDDTIDSLKHSLMNEVETEEGWKPAIEVIKGKDGNFYQVEVKPMVNVHGTYKIISVVKRYLNRNLMMSNLSEDIIFRILKRLKVDLVMNLGVKYEEYEIDQQDLSIIVRIVMDSIEATLYRAYENGERRYLNTINKRVETYHESASDNIQQPKKGIMGVFG